MADFNPTELDAIEDALELLGDDPNRSPAELLHETTQGKLLAQPQVEERLEDYAAIMREAELAMPPVEASTSVLSAIIDAGREACTEPQPGDVQPAAVEESPSQAAKKTSRPWLWLLTACASAAAVVLAVQSLGPNSALLGQSESVAMRASKADSDLVASKVAEKYESPRRPGSVMLAEAEPPAEEEPRNDLALSAPVADALPGLPAAQPAAKPGAGLRGAGELDGAAGHDFQARAEPRAKSARVRARSSRTKMSKRKARKALPSQGIYDEIEDLGLDDEDAFGGAASGRPSAAQKLEKKSAKKAKPSLGGSSKGGSPMDEGAARRALALADGHRGQRRCASAKSEYRELLRRLRVIETVWVARYQASAEAGLGLCALSSGQKKSAEAHFKTARGYWPGIESTIARERRSINK